MTEKRGHSGDVLVPLKMFDDLRHQLAGAARVREERDALLLRVAALEERIAEKDEYIASLEAADDLDLVQMKKALAVVPGLTHATLRRLYLDGFVRGAQKAKGARIWICRRSLRTYVAKLEWCESRRR